MKEKWIFDLFLLNEREEMKWIVNAAASIEFHEFKLRRDGLWVCRPAIHSTSFQSLSFINFIQYQSIKQINQTKRTSIFFN